jgi:hypothetical protein
VVRHAYALVVWLEFLEVSGRTARTGTVPGGGRPRGDVEAAADGLVSVLLIATT